MSPKWKYILLYGEGWAACLFIITLLLDRFWHHEKIDAAAIIIGLAIYPLGGIFFGHYLWALRQRRLGR